MAKPEWGSKRVCLSCGAKFYDFAREPIVCPKCEASFSLSDFNKTKKPKAEAKPVPVPEPKPEPEPVSEALAEKEGRDD